MPNDRIATPSRVPAGVGSALREARRANLKRLLNPRHVAFIGGKTVAPGIEMLRRVGFQGGIWPVNPKYDSLGGLPAFKAIADLPEGPDAAFLYVPKSITADVIASLAAVGGGGAVCFAAGYAELGDGGRSLQTELACAAGPLAVVGPNSTGFLNYFDGAALWPVSDHPPYRLEKGIAIVSSSGGILFNYSVNQRSVAAGYMIGVGNQACLDYSDYVDVLVDDPRVSAIGLVTEDLGDIASFSRAAAKAFARGVPVVALKTGASEAGARMARTHSGALVASDELVSALFERTGAIRVRSLPALDETLKMVTTTRIPKGRRLAVLTNSGGEKALAADAAAATAIELPQPSEPAARSLAAQIPDFAVVSNPFDYNAYFSGSGEDVFSSDNPAALERCFRTMLDDGYDVAMMLAGARTYPDGSSDPPGNTVDAWIAANRGAERAVAMCSVMPEHLPRSHRALLIANGVAPLQGIDDAMAAIDAAIRWGEKRSRPISPEDMALPEPRHLAASSGLLTEMEAKQALAACGLRVPAARVAAPDGAAAAADEVGYPVVVKAHRPTLAHKARASAVALQLGSAAAVTQAVEAMRARLRAHGHDLAEVLVERMVEQPVAELIVGVSHETRFGYAMVFGHGGVAVERLKDVRTGLLPMGQDDLRRLVDSSSSMRGLDANAVGAVAEAVAAVARFVERHRDRLVSLDVNPLIVTASGEAVAVDALVAMAAEDAT